MTMRIHVLSVGLGDSAILESEKNGEKFWSLIDCKKYGPTTPAVEFLKERNIRNIQSIFISHFHLDHISGLPDLADYLESAHVTLEFLVFPPMLKHKRIVKALIEASNTSIQTSLLDASIKALDSLAGLKNSRGEQAERSYFIYEKDPPEIAWKPQYHKGLSFSALSPNANMLEEVEKKFLVHQIDPQSSKVNSLSHCLLVRESTRGPLGFFPGDIEEAKVWRFVNNNISRLTIGKSNEIGFIKMAHHGAWQEIYSTVLPELLSNKQHKVVASISCPSGDRHHPHANTLNILAKRCPNTEIVCTNRAVPCEFGGEEMLSRGFPSEKEEIFRASAGIRNIGDSLPKGIKACAGNHEVVLAENHVSVKKQYENECQVRFSL